MKTLETKHTPGPWKCSQLRATQDTFHWIVEASATDDGRKVDVCECYPISDDGQTGAMCHANATLIAAAPEMLAALEMAATLIRTARQYYPNSMHNSDKFNLENACATIGSALHKAKGGQ